MTSAPFVYFLFGPRGRRSKRRAGRFASRCLASMRPSLLILVLTMCAVTLHAASASEGALETANAVLRSIQSKQFEQAAGRFRFPDSFSPEELRNEQAEIASNLRSLFRITGKFQGTPSPETGFFVTLKFTLRAGDRNHPLPEAVSTKSAAYRFAAPLENYRDGRVELEIDNDAGTWKVRSLSFALPASDPSSVGRMKELFNQMVAGRGA